MIIDLILDRKDGVPYDAREFYHGVRGYEDVFDFEPYITEAMDYGTNDDVIGALCRYIDEQEYNPKIKDWIKTQIWVTDDDLF